MKRFIRWLYFGMYYSKMFIKFRSWISKYLRNRLEGTIPESVRVIRNDFIPNGLPTVYTFNHCRVNDIPASILSLDTNAHMVIGIEGDENNPTFKEWVFLWLNGYVRVRRNDPESKRQAFRNMMRVLKNQGQLVIFPEAVLNFSANKLMLPMHWGVIRLTEFLEINIVPNGMELIDGEYRVIRDKQFDYSKYNREEGIIALRDTLATLVYEFMLNEGLFKRQEVTVEEWLEHINEQLLRLPKKKWWVEEEYIFKPKGHIDLGEVLADLFGLTHRTMAADYARYMRIENLKNGWNNTSHIGRVEEG